MLSFISDPVNGDYLKNSENNSNVLQLGKFFLADQVDGDCRNSAVNISIVSQLEKGKPIERWGRKTKGLRFRGET